MRSVEKLDYAWSFRFDEPLVVLTEAHWRLIASEGIVVSSEDDGQQFGLPQPVNAAEQVRQAVGSSKVSQAIVNAQTGDLRIEFANGRWLEILQMSSGYEAWRAHTAMGEAICMGGGQLVFIGHDASG